VSDAALDSNHNQFSGNSTHTLGASFKITALLLTAWQVFRGSHKYDFRHLMVPAADFNRKAHDYLRHNFEEPEGSEYPHI